LVRPLVVLDVSAKARNSADYEITVEDIAQWEQVNGPMPPNALVLARTGSHERWGRASLYRNADKTGTKHFPGYSVEAAQFLVEGRDAAGLGIDTLSVDPGASMSLAVHRYCARRSVYHIENIANLKQAPPVGALAVAAPASSDNGFSGPVRVLALIR
jgi:kynurenine formamidase